MGGRLFAFLCWIVLLSAIAVFAAVSFFRFEHRADADRRHALAGEQRRVAAAAAAFAEDLAAGTVPAASSVGELRARSLELLARIPPGPVADLQAEWRRLVTALDTIETEWARLLDFRTGLEALGRRAWDLRADSDRLAGVLAGGNGVPPGLAEALANISRQFAEEVERTRLTEPAGLDRARELLDLHSRVQGLLATTIARERAVDVPQGWRTPTLHLELAAVASGIDAARRDLGATLAMGVELEAAAAGIRHLVESSARVMALLPLFESRSERTPVLLGASLDAWILQSAGLVLAALLGLFWWRGRLLRAEAAVLDQAWGEAAASDWRARGFVRDLLRAIDSLDRRRPAKGAPMDDGNLERFVRTAIASLPRIVARRSQSAAALLSAREPLRKRLAASRDSVLAHLGADTGKVDTGPLVEIETTFRQAALFAMAALVREVRATASVPAPVLVPQPKAQPRSGDPEAAEAANVADPAAVEPAPLPDGPETVEGTAARAFDLLEASLDRVLAGEGEGHAEFIFLLDDLRTVQGKEPFSSSLDFDPDLARPVETGSKRGAALRPDAARVLPSFRKGLAEWTAGDRGGDSAARLLRGCVSVLARAAEEGLSPARSFWAAASAFCTALCGHAIPAGPAVRRIMGEVAREFEETAERKEAPPPPDRLLRELLLYVALAESDDPEIEAVRAAFELERFALAIPEHPGATELADDVERADVSEEIIQQLEGIRAALDRIDGPQESTPRTPPSH